MQIFGLRLFQVIVIVFAVFALTRVMMQRKNKNFSINEFIFWSLIWIGLIAVSFSKPLLQDIADLIEIQRGVDLLIYGSITMLFYMLYRLYAKVDSQQQEITKIVTKSAINNSKKKK